MVTETNRQTRPKAQQQMRVIYNWLFRGSRVYLLSEPDRMLKTVNINWDEQTTDVQDEDGTILYGVPWDSLEFWNPDDYHIAGED